MEGPRSCALALAAVLVLAAGPALADDTALDLARHDVDTSDYLAARGALVSALDAGNASPAELAEVYKLSGIVEGALGDAAAATTAFEKWLVLDPKGALPPGTSPKITRPYDAASAKVKAQDPLRVKPETTTDPPTLTVVIVNDPVRMITRARAFVRADGKPEVKVEAAGTRRIKLELPPGKRLDVRVQALDAHGNRVVELGSADVPIVITGAEAHDDHHDGDHVVIKKPPKPDEPPPNPRPLVLKWWAWGAVGVAFAGAGAYFGFVGRSDASKLDDLNANSQNHQFTEATDLESKTRRELLLFDIGMATAGVFAIGATILYLTEPKVTTETRVTAVPVRGGGAFVIGGRF